LFGKESINPVDWQKGLCVQDPGRVIIEIRTFSNFDLIAPAIRGLYNDRHGKESAL
jgi:hypothetical protein